MNNYTGLDSFPTTLQLIDDSDDPTGANFAVFSEGAADRTKFLFNRAAKVNHQDFSGSGSFVVPAKVTLIEVDAWGGGGGGGAGRTGAFSNEVMAGGGGGGGSIASLQTLVVTPGETLTIVIGAGGTGGATSSAAGTDGGDTTVTGIAGTITFLGAQSGLGGAESTSPDFAFGLGGAPVRTGWPHRYPAGVSSADMYRTMTPGAGGAGVSSANTSLRDGNSNPRGYGGGESGTVGTDDGGLYGGGGGGGGGAGPGLSFGGSGDGAGGAGGNAHAAAPGGAGGTGQPGRANSGMGGGGGGAGGGGTSGGAFAAGRAGGSGFARLIWLEHGTW